jgi:hypothetical protein
MNEVLSLTAANPLVLLLSTVFYGVWISHGIALVVKLGAGEYKYRSDEHIQAHRLACESLGIGIGGFALFVLATQFQLHMVWPAIGSMITFWLGLQIHLKWKRG